MAIKDYKSQAPISQTSTNKQANGNRGFKKTAIGFGIGLLSGVFITVAVYIIYLDNDHEAVNNIRNAVDTIPKATDNNIQAEPTKTAPLKNQTIDYLFYEELKNFELPPPTQDQPPETETQKQLLPNNQDIPPTPNNDDEVNGKDVSPTRYILQAGTFTDAGKAQTQRRKIVDLGYKDAHIFQTAVDGKQHYRVWLGPYTNIEKAKTIGNVLKGTHIEVMLRYDLRNFDPKAKQPD